MNKQTIFIDGYKISKFKELIKKQGENQ